MIPQALEAAVSRVVSPDELRAALGERTGPYAIRRSMHGPARQVDHHRRHTRLRVRAAPPCLRVYAPAPSTTPHAM